LTSGAEVKEYLFYAHNNSQAKERACNWRMYLQQVVLAMPSEASGLLKISPLMRAG